MLEYDGSTYNFNDDISVTNFNGISISKLYSYGTSRNNGSTSGNVRNIKIKLL